VSETTVTRWRRYGQDRLYVRTATGDLLGHEDLKTGAVVLEVGGDRAALDVALAAHPASTLRLNDKPRPVALDDRPPALPSSRSPLDDQLPTPAENPAPTAPAAQNLSGAAWGDLAGNRPGQAARAKAVALRRAAPVRTFFDRLFGRRTEERRWRIGADGEEAVGAELAGLNQRWRVLHAVPIGDRGTDVDHVVIGPPGVFIVNTKHHPTASVWVGGWTFIVNGQRLDYTVKSRNESRWATSLLKAASPSPTTVAVTGVIALVGVRGGLTIKSQPKGVHVTARRDIRAWLEQQPDRLTEEQVRALFEVARRSTTWRRA
jgi:hypothetical protein